MWTPNPVYVGGHDTGWAVHHMDVSSAIDFPRPGPDNWPRIGRFVDGHYNGPKSGSTDYSRRAKSAVVGLTVQLTACFSVIGRLR
jgi:hypothetical protein